MNEETKEDNQNIDQEAVSGIQLTLDKIETELQRIKLEL